MNPSEQIDRFAIQYIDDLLDRLIISNDGVMLIQKDKSAIHRLTFGFGAGLAGIRYFLIIAERALGKTHPEFSRKVQDALIQMDQSISVSMDQSFEFQKTSPLNHGFLHNTAGLMLEPNFYSSSANWNEILEEKICEFYKTIDLHSVNPLFYGGLSGLVFLLSKRVLSGKSNQPATKKLIEKCSDILSEIALTKKFEDYFKEMKPYPSMVGLAWGTSGVIFALGLANRVLEGRKYDEAIEILIKNEDQHIDSESKYRNHLMQMNPDSKPTYWHPLCYGTSGVIVSRLATPQFFSQERQKMDFEELNAIQPDLYTCREEQKHSFCCGVAGSLEVMSQIPSANVKNEIQDYLLQRILNSTLENSIDLFIQGPPGILSVALKQTHGIQDPIFGVDHV